MSSSSVLDRPPINVDPSAVLARHFPRLIPEVPLYEDLTIPTEEIVGKIALSDAVVLLTIDAVTPNTAPEVESHKLGRLTLYDRKRILRNAAHFEAGRNNEDGTKQLVVFTISPRSLVQKIQDRVLRREPQLPISGQIRTLIPKQR